MKLYEYKRRPDLMAEMSAEFVQEIDEKIYQYHAFPMSLVREKLGSPIFVSQASGYRPVEHELEQGRSGDSQHTFEGKGAADYICSDMRELATLMIDHTGYTRLCYYPNATTPFIHADYKADYLQLFLNRDKWVYVGDGQFWEAF